MFETNDPEELKKQIEELNAKVKRISLERDLYKETVNSYLQTRPFEPPTAEELEDMLNGPRGESISEVIAQLEKEWSIDDISPPFECGR